MTESLLAREGAKAPPKKEEPKSGKDYTVTIEGVGEFKALSFSFRGENEVVVMKETDELTTELMRLAREGKSLKVVITAPHMTLTLEGTIISGYNVGSGRDKPVETLTFNYTTQSIKYHGDDDAGGASTDYP